VTNFHCACYASAILTVVVCLVVCLPDCTKTHLRSLQCKRHFPLKSQKIGRVKHPPYPSPPSVPSVPWSSHLWRSTVATPGTTS